MNKNKEYSFILEDISFPLIFSSYKETKGTKKPSLVVLYRIQAYIISPETIKILFGSQVNHEKQKESPVSIRVETLGVFKFKEKIFNNKNRTVDSIKSLPNMLAILFPFIREKIHSSLSNNKIIFHLPPLNTFKLVENMKDKIIVIDERQNQSK